MKFLQQKVVLDDFCERCSHAFSTITSVFIHLSNTNWFYKRKSANCVLMAGAAKICKYYIFVAKICKHALFVVKICKCAFFVAKICKRALDKRFCLAFCTKGCQLLPPWWCLTRTPRSGQTPGKGRIPADPACFHSPFSIISSIMSSSLGREGGSQYQSTDRPERPLKSRFKMLGDFCIYCIKTNL